MVGAPPPHRIRTGLDRLAEHDLALSLLRDRRVGVLGHAASCTSDYVPLPRRLAELGVQPAVWFGPEHGFGGAAQDMVGVHDARDEEGTRVVSLYGDRAEDLVPHPDDLRGLDRLLIDLVDVGARYYTYVWTALLAVEAAAKVGVPSLILDRPNPLGRDRVEGRLVDDGYRSFVGWAPVPIRHGLTLAEMVLAFFEPRAALGADGAVAVVATEGGDGAPLPLASPGWVQPSPNMPHLATARVYPGGCLLEGTLLSEGRGHTRPFEFFGAPFVDGERLARDLHALGLPGFVARPVVFIPTFHKHGGQPCGGLQVHVTDVDTFRPVATYAAAIALCHHQNPEAFRFRTERYEFIDDIPAFDLLTGSAEAREAIVSGASPRAVAEAVSTVDVAAWAEVRDRARARFHDAVI
ncbi:MAG: DUF1343 domain-containing protein [Myxococcota bacterium]